MVIRETKPNRMFTRHIQELSEEETKRVQEICDELREIFNADSVGFVAPELTASNKTDYTIRIYNGDTINYIF
jgi:diaminopimelate epimerase